MGEDIDSIRHNVHLLALGLKRSTRECRALLRKLPTIPEPMLSLQEPPNVAAAHSMALEQALEELPELAEVLERAATTSTRALGEDHRRLLRVMDAAESPSYRGPDHE